MWNNERQSLVSCNSLSAALVGTVVEIDLSHSGLATENSVLNYYVREESVRLWEFLETSEDRALAVFGTPGVGKSVEVFYYAMYVAREKSQRVLYIHSENNNVNTNIVFIDDASTDSYRHAKEHYCKRPKHLFNFILSQMKAGTVDMIILDGELSWLINEVHKEMSDASKITLIICTSFQSLNKSKSQNIIRMVTVSRFLVLSWRKDELEAAVAKGAMVLQTTFTEIYYYAGGSARHMQLKVKKVKNFIEEKVAECSDISNLIGMIMVGDASKMAVNSLIAFYDEFSTIVSQYAMEHMLNKMSSEKALIFARTMVTGCQALKGWLAEYDFIWLAKHKKKLKMLQCQKGLVTWVSSVASAANSWIYFDRVNDIIDKTSCQWLFPSKSNQPCFDAIFRVSEHHAKFVQITIKKTHSCDIEMIIPFINALGVHIVDFVFVCQSTNFKAFKYPKVDETSVKSALRAIFFKKKKTGIVIPKHGFLFSKCSYQKRNTYDPL